MAVVSKMEARAQNLPMDLSRRSGFGGKKGKGCAPGPAWWRDEREVRRWGDK